mgnify:FL=1
MRCRLVVTSSPIETSKMSYQCLKDEVHVLTGIHVACHLEEGIEEIRVMLQNTTKLHV